MTFKETPAAFSAAKCGSHGCGFSTPDQSIVRTADGNLLMALYGHAADGGYSSSPGIDSGSPCSAICVPALTRARFLDRA